MAEQTGVNNRMPRPGGLESIVDETKRSLGHFAAEELIHGSLEDRLMENLMVARQAKKRAADERGILRRTSMDDLARYVEDDPGVAAEDVVEAFVRWMALFSKNRLPTDDIEQLIVQYAVIIDLMRQGNATCIVVHTEEDTSTDYPVLSPVRLVGGDVRAIIDPKLEKIAVTARGEVVGDGEGVREVKFNDFLGDKLITNMSEVYATLKSNIEYLSFREAYMSNDRYLVGLHNTLTIFEENKDYPDAPRLRTCLDKHIYNVVCKLISGRLPEESRRYDALLSKYEKLLSIITNKEALDSLTVEILLANNPDLEIVLAHARHLGIDANPKEPTDELDYLAGKAREHEIVARVYLYAKGAKERQNELKNSALRIIDGLRDIMNDTRQLDELESRLVAIKDILDGYLNRVDVEEIKIALSNSVFYLRSCFWDATPEYKRISALAREYPPASKF